MAYFYSGGQEEPPPLTSDVYYHPQRKLPEFPSSDRSLDDDFASEWSYTSNDPLVPYRHHDQWSYNLLEVSTPPASSPLSIIPSSQPLNYYYSSAENYQSKDSDFVNGRREPREQLIQELSLSSPGPPSALSYFRSFEDRQRLQEDEEEEEEGLVFNSSDYRPAAFSCEGGYSCPVLPQVLEGSERRQPNLFRPTFTPFRRGCHPPDVVIETSERKSSGQGFFAGQFDDRCFTGGSPASLMSTPSSSMGAEQKQTSRQLEGRNINDFTQTSSCVGGRSRETATHLSLVNNNQQDLPRSQSLAASHSTTVVSQSTAPTASCAEGGVSQSEVSKEYKEWTKLLLPEKRQASRGHRPLTESRSAEPDPKQMVLQGSDRRLLLLSPSTAEVASIQVGSPKLPQRSRSLRNPSKDRRAAYAQKPPSNNNSSGQSSGSESGERKIRQRTGSMPESAKIVSLLSQTFVHLELGSNCTFSFPLTSWPPSPSVAAASGREENVLHHPNDWTNGRSRKSTFTLSDSFNYQTLRITPVSVHSLLMRKAVLSAEVTLSDLEAIRRARITQRTVAEVIATRMDHLVLDHQNLPKIASALRPSAWIARTLITAEEAQNTPNDPATISWYLVLKVVGRRP